MNIEIANRLVNLRKSNNLSQEALAEKLGISRQAVSKWERAEASPDTDNLILLARLYKVSLDELLKTEDEIPMPETESTVKGGISMSETESSTESGIPMLEKKESGIVLDEAAAEEYGKRIEEPDFMEESEEYGDGGSLLSLPSIPMALIITIIYILIGCTFGAWHPGWLLFMLIPIWETLVRAIRRKNANCFAYPILAALIYLCGGFYWDNWHPGWLIFLTVPLYYSVVSYIHSLKRWQKTHARKEGSYDGKDGGIR